MTLRHQRFHVLFAAALMVVVAGGFGGEAWGQRSGTHDGPAPADPVRGELGELPPWQRMLTGEDSIHVAELDEQITELREQAKYAEAIPLAEEALQIRRQVQGEGHWQVTDAVQMVRTLKYIADLPADAQSELAEADRLGPESRRLYEQGKYGEALSLVRRRLEVSELLLGDEHPDVAASLSRLGAVLVHTGDYVEAELSLREALAMRRKLLGEEHPDVAKSLNALAAVLYYRGDYAGAEPLFREVLALRRKLLGEEHRDVAATLSSLALQLVHQGDYAGAEPLYREALAMKRNLLGEEHLEVAGVLSNLAELLREEGDYAGAEPLFREALAMRRKILGYEHPYVAGSLDELGRLLVDQGDYAGAEPLLREALALRRKLLGEAHPEVANGLVNLARLLFEKGDYADAEQLYREVLARDRKLRGREHQYVASSLCNLAAVLYCQGDYAGAEPLYREALAMQRKLLGDEHLDVAASLNNLAVLLDSQGDRAGAEVLHRESLAMRRKLLGEEHPAVARSLNNLANVLYYQGDYADAESLYREALAMRRKLLGEEHQEVAKILDNIAKVLFARGEQSAAEAAWAEAAESFGAARLRVGAGGLERAGFGTEWSPLAPLAACLARNGKPVLAWARLEENMARGLLDEVSVRVSRPLKPEELDREDSLLGQLARLDERINASLSADDSTGEAAAWADTLRWRRDALLAELSGFEAGMAAKYGVAAGETYELGRIQEALPSDAALLAWVDLKGDSHAVDPNGEHWACVVRQEGDPVWVRLPGSGDGSWTEADSELPSHVREALGEGIEVEGDTPQGLLKQLQTQRLAPIEPHLSGIRRLIVLPAGWMAGIPVEALTDDYAISYAPSATMYAWLKEGRRSQVEGPRSKDETQTPASPGEAGRSPLLALGDPVFGEPVEPDTVLPEPPDHGILLAMVMDGSNAARGGLRPGDVLLSYGEEELASADDLGPAIEQVAEATEDSSRSVPVRVWRDGETLDVAVAPGKLGVDPSTQPAPEAVLAKRRLDSVLERTRGRTFEPLPGSRLEVEAIAGLFAAEGAEAPTLLLGAEASERRLDELATSGDLGRYRHIHLATHALMDNEVAMRSALILSKETDDALERVLEGKEVYDGRLTAEQIVRTWKLNAELVTLSGCETALGKASGGEGFLGFSQALFVAGARSLVLSLWEVEDTPTMLLMRRFYENLLGRFEGPRRVSGQVYEPGAPLPKVDALREAKTWLRELTWDDLMELEAARDPAAPGPGAEVMVAGGGSDRLYEHPHYWAAFILMGNPD